MTAPLPPAPTPIRLALVPAVDTEAPYVERSGPASCVDGALALDPPVPLRLPAGEPDTAPLRLVPAPAAPRVEPERPEPPEPGVAPLRPAADATRQSFGPVRTERAALPPPGPLATTLIRAVLEVIAGDRPVRQLARCASTSVYDELEVLVSRTAPRPWAGTLRRILLSEPAPGVAEVTAVVTRGVRVAAVAMRLEGVDGRWQLTALQLG